MNSLTLSLNEILEQWKKQYDFLDSISSTFAVSNGLLCFDRYPLFAADDLLLSGAEYDAESILFFFSGNRSVNVSIFWPEDLPPVVSSVSFAYVLQHINDSEDQIEDDSPHLFI